MKLSLSSYSDIDHDEDSAISIGKHDDMLNVKRGDFISEFELGGKSGNARIQNGSLNGLTTLLKFAFTLSALNYDGFFIHSAAARHNDQCTIFPGRSGAGKTTLMRKIRKHTIMTDEFTLVARSKNGWHVYSTPFRGELEFSIQPQSALFDNLMYLDRSGTAGLTEISHAESVYRLIQNIVGWGYEERKDDLMKLADDMVSSGRSFTLSYSLDEDPNKLINLQ